MTGVIDITAMERRLVHGILKNFLPADAKVWVFGSRATGKTRRASDLDLAVDAGRPLMLTETARLSESFDEAPLPFAVDVVDLQSISEAFKSSIAPSMLVWTED